MSHHTAGLRNSKLREDGGRNIRQRRIGRVNRAITQEHSRDQGEVHAMVAAPGIGVVLEDIGGGVSEYGLPSRAIAAIVAYDQIGPLLRVRPLIDLAGSINSRNRSLIVLRIA